MRDIPAETSLEVGTAAGRGFFPARLLSWAMKAKGAHLALLIVIAIASVPLIVAMWLGGGLRVLLVLGGNTVPGVAVALAGAAWAVHVLRDKTLPGLLVGTVHSLLVAGLAKDPWDEDDDSLARRLADED